LENVREFHSRSHGNAFVCDASVVYCMILTFLAPGDWLDCMAWLLYGLHFWLNHLQEVW